jgi:hypothetical protein
MFILAYPLTRLPAYPLTRLPAYPLTRLPAYPLTRLPAYPLTRFPASPLPRFHHVLTLASSTSPANRNITLGNQAATRGLMTPPEPIALVS